MTSRSAVTCLRAVAMLIIGTIGVASNGQDHPQQMETLNTDELRALLRNVSLIRVEDPGVITSHVPVERYFESGEYLSVGGRARREGTFNIEGGCVCVQLSLTGGPECYRLQRDREGTLWKVDDPNHPPIRVRVLPME